MNKFVIAAAFAVSTFASAIPAQAEGPVVIQGIYQQQEVVGGGHQHHRCLPGYDFYPDKGECIEMHAPKLVQKAACKVGEFRQVPDPSKPNGFRILECRNLD